MLKYLVAVTAIFSLTACGDGSITLTPDQQIKADNGGLHYAKDLGGAFIQCSGLDSNANKYVTCSIKMPDGAVKEIECAYDSIGCKQK